MQLANRMQTLSESITIAISTKAKEMKAAGIDVISLSAGEPDFMTPKKIRETVKNALDNDSKSGKYTPVPGLPEVIEAIRAKLKRDNGLDYKANQIVTNIGAKHSLFNVFQALINPGDEVIIPSPYWVSYPEIVKFCGGVPVFIGADESTNFKVTAEQLKKAITPKTKLIYLANPNNPTGTFSSAVEIADFLAQVPPQVIVALDEAYVEFTEPSERVDSFGLLAKYPNLIVCRTLSKAYGLAGLRIGYAVSSTEIAGLLNRVRQPFNCNSLALAAATAAIQDDEFVAKVAENNRIGLQLLQNFFDEKGLRYVPSKGNFVMLDLQQPAAPIYQALLRKGVIVRPLAGYGLPNHLRISIGLPEENQRFLTALSDILGL